MVFIKLELEDFPRGKKEQEIKLSNGLDKSKRRL